MWAREKFIDSKRQECHCRKKHYEWHWSFLSLQIALWECSVYIFAVASCITYCLFCEELRIYTKLQTHDLSPYEGWNDPLNWWTTQQEDLRVFERPWEGQPSETISDIRNRNLWQRRGPYNTGYIGDSESSPVIGPFEYFQACDWLRPMAAIL